MLSLAKQIAPVRQLATHALESYPLVDPRMRFITHGENTTFMVDASVPHADNWSPPDGFVRIRWDSEAFFGDVMEYGGIDAGNVWDLLPTELRHMFESRATQSTASSRPSNSLISMCSSRLGRSCSGSGSSPPRK